MNKEEIQSKLEGIALKRTIAFCYHDYIECPNGRCPKCGSDDLMRLLPSYGCEYGLNWVIKEILRSELEPVNLADSFESSIRDCYPEDTQVAWAKFDTVSILKELDPISWECAQGDWESMEESEGNIISFDCGSNYYQMSELEDFLEESEQAS